MDSKKSDFCVHLINGVDSLLDFIRANHELFLDGITPENYNKVDGNHYFPPHTAQNLVVENVYLTFILIKNNLSALHENVLFDWKL